MSGEGERGRRVAAGVLGALALAAFVTTALAVTAGFHHSLTLSPTEEKNLRNAYGSRQLVAGTIGFLFACAAGLGIVTALALARMRALGLWLAALGITVAIACSAYSWTEETELRGALRSIEERDARAQAMRNEESRYVPEKIPIAAVAFADLPAGWVASEPSVSSDYNSDEPSVLMEVSGPQTEAVVQQTVPNDECERSACQQVGTDSQGRPVYRYKVFARTFHAVKLNGTIIKMWSGQTAQLTDVEALTIAGSIRTG